MITPKKQAKEKSRRKLFEVLDRVNNKNKEVSEEEVVKYATMAVAELRAENRQKRSERPDDVQSTGM